MTFNKMIPPALTFLIPFFLSPVFADTTTPGLPDSSQEMLEPIREARAKTTIWQHTWVRNRDGFFDPIRRKVCERAFSALVFDIRNNGDKGFAIDPGHSASCRTMSAQGPVEISAHAYILIGTDNSEMEEVNGRDEKFIRFDLRFDPRSRVPSPQRDLTSEIGVFELGRTELTNSLSPSVSCNSFSECRRKSPEFYTADFYILDEGQ